LPLILAGVRPWKICYDCIGAVKEELAVAGRRGRIGAWLRGTLRQKERSETPATETLAQAVDGLKSGNLARRLTAIDNLERIARDSTADHWLAIENLTAFLRHRSPWPISEPDSSQQERADIQAAILVLGRRKLTPRPEEAAHRLDLRHVDLRGIWLRRNEGNFEFAMFTGSCLVQADLRRANLAGANLQGADLTKANLRKADLNGAYLQGSTLRGARLNGAHLWDAALDHADLRGASLRGAGLVDARLVGADLTNAKLRCASMKHADIRSAKGLAGRHLTRAWYWPRAYRDERLGRGEALPKD
jgi:uncharacterized protein YjbI with pentapeptide repeats